MFKLAALDHVALSVTDVQRSAAWYIEVLGFEQQHAGLWNGVPVFVGRGAAAIALFPSKRSTRGSSTGSEPIKILHFAFRTDRENFLLAESELKERGIRFEFQDHDIAHSIYLHDPDGHEIEITTYDIAVLPET